MNKFLLVTLLTLHSVGNAETTSTCPFASQGKPTASAQAVLKNPSVATLKKQLKGKKLVVVDVYADWCSPCKLMHPIVDALAQDTDLKEVVFIKVAHDNQELIKFLNTHLADGKTSVPSIPYFFVFKNGKAIDQFTGAMAQTVFKSKILKHINPNDSKSNA